MSNSVEQFKNLLKEYDKEQEEKQFNDVDVTRGGEKITLPEGMSYEEGRTWLTRAEEAEETRVNIHSKIECYPLDGALALSKALKRLYGFTHLHGTKGLFGTQPPTMVDIPIGVNERTSVMWGEFSPPGMEDTNLKTGMDIDSTPKFIIRGSTKRKYREKIQQIINLTEQIVKTESIYQGKAVRVNLNPSGGFDPVDSAPKFMDLRDVNPEDLILNESTEYDITTNVWSRITQTEAVKAQNIPLKHGVLLSGEYGTGKTMSARITAKKAQDNGWTFIYLEDSNQLADALRFAETYAPAVVFGEDIDKAVEGSTRTEEINKILNTLDGVDTKSKPIITILTTNHPENINRAFLRAGRIDSVIKMGKPTAKTAERFIRYYGGDLLKDDVDLEQASKNMEGFVAAFIDEAISKAKLYAIAREGEDIKGKVTGKDLAIAAQTLQDHVDMVSENDSLSEEEEFARAVVEVEEFKRRNTMLGKDVENTKENVNALREYLG